MRANLFWRDYDGNEVDLIVQNAGAVNAIEIKASQTMSREHIKGLKKFSKLVDQVNHFVVYTGEEKQHEYVPFTHLNPLII